MKNQYKVVGKEVFTPAYIKFAKKLKHLDALKKQIHVFKTMNQIKKILFDLNEEYSFLDRVILLTKQDNIFFTKDIIFEILRLARHRYKSLFGFKRKDFKRKVFPPLIIIKGEVIKKEMNNNEIKDLIVKTIKRE